MQISVGFYEIWSILDANLKLTSSSYRLPDRSSDHLRFVLLISIHDVDGAREFVKRPVVFNCSSERLSTYWEKSPVEVFLPTL